jgi:adenylate cyclase
MASSTALTRRLGDAKAQDVRRSHNTIVREALKAHDGVEIKHTGDGIMASFATASSAIESAIAIQRGVEAHKQAHPDSPLAVYIGLNAGEPIAEERDLYGTSVDLASRMCEHAEPGQILASNVVRELAEGKGFLFADIGEVMPKGFENPVRVYEVRWREES